MLYDNDNITATVAETTNVQMPVDKTRRKRLKVVSACSECRRKKTKCNGEKPCAGCIKTNMDCKYANSAAKNKQQKQQTQKPQSQLQAQAQPQKSQPQPQRSLVSQNTSLQVQPQPQPQAPYQPACINDEQSAKTTSMIQAIEKRLSVIEDILQVFLANSHYNNDHRQSFVSQQYHPHHHYHQQQQQQQHSAPGPYHGDYSNNNKRKYSDYYSQDDSLKLPPPHNYQPTLSESSSTSTASSVCSTGSSPKISAIQTLLNNDTKSNEDYSAPPIKRPSAFFRPTPSNNHTITSGAGSPPVVVHREYYSAHGTVTGPV
ncbi:hypothetical protein BD560DRAFT_395661 [Blakeslea trispora]|nr:hypothetical protein BD560DRAFT_395661 [Blakeslea trispora]